jgi:hypothetical protein
MRVGCDLRQISTAKSRKKSSLGTKPAISQLNDFNREIGMDAPAEFRKHAADCETMTKVSSDPETKGAWKRMAERWILCAKLAEDQDLFLRRRVEERSLKAASSQLGSRPR